MAMAMRIFFLVLLINACALARDPRYDRQRHQRQRYQRHGKMFHDLEPQDARTELETDGGKLEVWGGRGSGVFEDANVAACRTTLRRRGLWLPSYIDSPSLHIVTNGRGRVGVIGSFGDRRTQENTYCVEKGDVVATPEGAVLWWYNDQDEDLVIVGAADVTEGTRPAGVRAFHLAGGRQGDQRERREEQPRERREDEKSEQAGYGAVIHGFSTEVLSRAWEMDRSQVKELLESQSEMGIVRLDEDIHFPETDERRDQNLFFKNFVYRFDRVNPDIRTKNGGELRELNSYRLPVLKRMGLGMECVKLQKDAMIAPNWFRNAHQVLYVMEGRGKIEAVRNNGERVLDVDLEEGSLVVIPAFFPSAKIAGGEGFHYISFLTNDRPMISYLSGRNSIYQGIPLRVLSKMMNVDEERARQIQRAHDKHAIIFPSESATRGRYELEDLRRRREEDESSRRRSNDDEEIRRREDEETRRRRQEEEEERRRRRGNDDDEDDETRRRRQEEDESRRRDDEPQRREDEETRRRRQEEEHRRRRGNDDDEPRRREDEETRRRRQEEEERRRRRGNDDDEPRRREDEETRRRRQEEEHRRRRGNDDDEPRRREDEETRRRRQEEEHRRRRGNDDDEPRRREDEETRRRHQEEEHRRRGNDDDEPRRRKEEAGRALAM